MPLPALIGTIGKVLLGGALAGAGQAIANRVGGEEPVAPVAQPLPVPAGYPRPPTTGPVVRAAITPGGSGCYRMDAAGNWVRVRRRRRTGLTKSQMNAIVFLKSQGVPAKEAAGLVISGVTR